MAHPTGTQLVTRHVLVTLKTDDAIQLRVTFRLEDEGEAMRFLERLERHNMATLTPMGYGTEDL